MFDAFLCESCLVQKLSKSRQQEGEQKRSHMWSNWGLIMDICAIQGRWTELSQICQHLPSDLVWQEFRQRAAVLPTVRNNPKVFQTLDTKLPSAESPPVVAPSNLSYPYTCCHSFTFNDIANCSNYVTPDLKVVIAQAPPPTSTPQAS